MLTNTHTPTLVLTFFIAATAIGVVTSVDTKDTQLDIAAIEAPRAVPLDTQTQNTVRPWWNILGDIVDWLQ